MFFVVIVLVLVIITIISYFAAKCFWEIAQMKGHSDSKYFWWCLFFGICGWIMVAALPDNRNSLQQNEMSDELPNL
ncbi:MAG TPA: hypothetical protein H9890_00805 [Candidatus Faecalibacterium intestinigallinarum]|uniref:Uncharacterized protein n=1 Tax=Candidatus Faecalibacterium intestinigallinarum TaxID=2838581 RepID=A0A9D1TVP8_9FIRM|nr:hypothetical protein [Candidatus Faecalibacterium intestinigallinarum]